MADYYELLGVSRDASSGEIKKSFRKLARELHPDVNPGDAQAEERFREVAAAYEVLSDDEKRAVYDRYGEDGLKQRHWEPQYASFSNLADIFSAFFGDDVFAATGRGGRAARATRGDNVLLAVEIDLREAALGTKRTLNYTVPVTCETCDGTGAERPEDRQTCDACQGQGVMRTVSRSLFGQIVQETGCPRCAGTGTIIISPCSTCGGTGDEVRDQEVTVDIPGGITDGQRIRLSGRGAAGPRGAAAGNLYIDVSVAADERFVRDGDDIVTVVDVTIAEAALGCRKDVDTIDDEPEQVEIPAGTQPGEVLVLRGRGSRQLRGSGRGDQRMIVNLLVPQELTAEQRDLLVAFQATESSRNYRQSEGLFDKLRRVLRT